MIDISRGFTPAEDERKKLYEIDMKLSDLVPQEEWETKSILWTPTNSTRECSGINTPMNAWAPLSSPSVSRGVDQVMKDHEIFASEKYYLSEKPALIGLDSRLDLLSQDPRVFFF